MLSRFAKYILPQKPKQFYDENGHIVVEEESHVSHLDEFFDLVFVVTLAHIGVKFRVDEDWSSLVSLFAHWIPMYYNWFVFESFLNRFSALVKWVYILYLGAFIGVIGVAVNVERCGLSTFTLADVPYRCFDFALFIFCGRMVVVLAWLMAAIGVSTGKAYCWWRVIAGMVPGVFYFASMWTMNQWLTMPVLWFVGIGLDIILHVVPSTIVWPFEYLPRHTHFTEERHAMMYIVALGECVIAAGIPVDVALPVGRVLGDRYGVMFCVTIMSFFLCVQNFVASDTAKLEHHGGVHALHVSRFSRCVWLSCQFLAVSAMVIAGAICKNISKKMELSQFFRTWFGASIAVIVMASAIAQLLHIYPPGDVRTCGRPVRFVVRASCSIIVFGLSFVPVGLLGEPSWIGIIAAVVALFTIIEWFGRNRVSAKGGHGHGGHGHGGHGHGDAHGDHHDDLHHDEDHGHKKHEKKHHGDEHDEHSVPLLGTVITDESLKGTKKRGH